MFDGLQTVAILVVAQVVGALLLNWMIDKKLSSTIQRIFGQPMVKGAMSVLGTKSAERKHQSAMVDQVATDILDTPKMKALKLGAKTLLNIDVDSYVEEHGAMDTLETLMAAGEALGFDINSLIASGMSGERQVSTGSGPHPYL